MVDSSYIDSIKHCIELRLLLYKVITDEKKLRQYTSMLGELQLDIVGEKVSIEGRG
jgi:hypothetical protein